MIKKGGLLLLFIVIFWSSNETPNVLAQSKFCERPFETVGIPLNDLGNNEYVRMDGEETGYAGGLYPNGENRRPPVFEASGIEIGRSVTPLGTDGQPNSNGRIVMVSIGMSNAAQEFRDFTFLTEEDLALNPLLAIVNGAQPGKITKDWVDPQAETWDLIDQRLFSGGLSPEQVQIAWVKNTQTGGGDFPEKILSIQEDLEQIARNIKIRFPNIKLAYFSSRTRSFTYWEGLSPEPTAYETGFAVKWMIEKQIDSDPTLNFDPNQGKVVAPYLSWGPYLWADGLNPRSDGLIWGQEDMVFDCTHPSDQGSAKIANLLMDFFKTDETTKTWFLNGALAPFSPNSSTTPTPNTFTPNSQQNWFDAILFLWNTFLKSYRIPY